METLNLPISIVNFDKLNELKKTSMIVIRTSRY